MWIVVLWDCSAVYADLAHWHLWHSWHWHINTESGAPGPHQLHGLAYIDLRLAEEKSVRDTVASMVAWPTSSCSTSSWPCLLLGHRRYQPHKHTKWPPPPTRTAVSDPCTWTLLGWTLFCSWMYTAIECHRTWSFMHPIRSLQFIASTGPLLFCPWITPYARCLEIIAYCGSQSIDSIYYQLPSMHRADGLAMINSPLGAAGVDCTQWASMDLLDEPGSLVLWDVTYCTKK